MAFAIRWYALPLSRPFHVPFTPTGVGFRDAGYTFLNPHGAPSGGDWGLQSPQYPEAGAVYLAGTENVVFDSCIFKYLDGNGTATSTSINQSFWDQFHAFSHAFPTPLSALRLSSRARRVLYRWALAIRWYDQLHSTSPGIYLAGYNRGATVRNCELAQIGDSPVALWG